MSSRSNQKTKAPNADLAASDPSLTSNQQLSDQLEPYGGWTVLESSGMSDLIVKPDTGSRLSLILLFIGLSILVLETILNRTLFHERLSIRRSTGGEAPSS